ncbi:ATP-binding protein, partial [Marinobacter sp.]
GICEERGSGIDKVIAQVEIYQLPAPIFEQTQEHTRVVLFSHRDYKDMEPEDRVRACYQHCCLKYVNREPMNNTSLRERLRIDEANSAMASRILKQTIKAGLIRLYDPNSNRKAYRYVPFWA